MSGQGEMEETKINVVVVDDEPRLADLFAAWLEPDWNVSTAYDGEQALETVNETTDVVLLDRRMPGLSGDEVLSLLRASGYGGAIIIVSAINPTGDIVDIDFDEYLVKPISKSQLIEKIESVSSRVSDGTSGGASEAIDPTAN